jgi:hypothetical protein
MPAKNMPEKLEPIKKIPSDDPFQTRLEKRMAVIGSADFVNTNTTPLEIAPGLTAAP